MFKEGDDGEWRQRPLTTGGHWTQASGQWTRVEGRESRPPPTDAPPRRERVCAEVNSPLILALLILKQLTTG